MLFLNSPHHPLLCRDCRPVSLHNLKNVTFMTTQHQYLQILLSLASALLLILATINTIDRSNIMTKLRRRVTNKLRKWQQGMEDDTPNQSNLTNTLINTSLESGNTGGNSTDSLTKTITTTTMKSGNTGSGLKNRLAPIVKSAADKLETQIATSVIHRLEQIRSKLDNLAGTINSHWTGSQCSFTTFELLNVRRILKTLEQHLETIWQDIYLTCPSANSALNKVVGEEEYDKTRASLPHLVLPYDRKECLLMYEIWAQLSLLRYRAEAGQDGAGYMCVRECKFEEAGGTEGWSWQQKKSGVDNERLRRLRVFSLETEERRRRDASPVSGQLEREARVGLEKLRVDTGVEFAQRKANETKEMGARKDMQLERKGSDSLPDSAVSTGGVYPLPVLEKKHDLQPERYEIVLPVSAS